MTAPKLDSYDQCHSRMKSSGWRPSAFLVRHKYTYGTFRLRMRPTLSLDRSRNSLFNWWWEILRWAG